MLVWLTGCAATTMQATATETTLCQKWGSSLPTRSHQDTPETKVEIQKGYAVFSLACPKFTSLVPH